MKKIILLSKAHGRRVILLSDEDYPEISKYSWHVYKDHNVFYVKRCWRINGKLWERRLHRQILGLTDPKIIVDHKDHNGLNNQRNNLRIVSSAQNIANMRSHKKSTSKYLGVSWNTKEQIWKAALKAGQTSYYLGKFENEVDAAIAYNKKAFELRGEFANLNVIL